MRAEIKDNKIYIYSRFEDKDKLKAIPGAAGLDPVELCKKLRRLELKAHRLAEDYCNGAIDIDKVDINVDNILTAVRKILGPAPAVFVNLDPRGYAIKIDDEIMRRNNFDLYQDWGGYGIIAPEFDGKR